MSWLAWPTLSADYAQYHQTPGNRHCHLVGIPLIVFSLVYCSRWPSGNPVPLLAIALPLYFYWGWKLGLGLTIFMALSAALSAILPVWTAVAAFLVGWVFQFAGHKIYEGKSPAFTRNLTHLLVGPAWILQEVIKPSLT